MRDTSTTPETASPADPAPGNETDTAPPVEPPSAGFLLRLFAIPLFLATIIVAVWLLFGGSVHLGSDPESLVRHLKKNDKSSWQSAHTLADLLRNPDHESLKQDARIAEELASVLQSHLDAGDWSPQSIRLRVFVSRALGEFCVPDVLPALLRASRVERDPAELDVRRAALEGLAVYVQNNGANTLRQNESLMDAVLAASRERSPANDMGHGRDELRSTAAYVLGVVGGARSADRLVFLLGDPYPNTRYNAAAALCRHGDARCLPVLLEMLDPQNEVSTQNETDTSGQAFKRLLVLRNGIRAAVQLLEKNATIDAQPIRKALREIVRDDLRRFPGGSRRSLRLDAEQALLEIGQRPH